MNEKRTPMSEEARALASDPRHIRFAKKEAMVLAARTGAVSDILDPPTLFGRGA